MSIFDYSPNPADNRYISSIYIGEGWLAPDVNNAFRQLMADLSGYVHTSYTSTSQLREIIATAGQISFQTVLPYTPGYMTVHVNGLLLPHSAYTALDGVNVVLNTPSAAGDVVVLDSFTSIGTATDASNILFQQDAGGSVPRDANTKLSELFSPEDFGAVGDGVTDDTTAFQTMNAALAAQGYGGVRLRRGATYRLGQQNPNTNGKRWDAEPCFAAENLTWFVLDGQGATLKFNDGLYFGGFDAANVPTTASPNFDQTQQANQGLLLFVRNCQFSSVRDVYFDGNAPNGIVGGPWGDTGRQCTAYGLYVAECGASHVTNCHAFNFLLDGMACRWTGQTVTTLQKPYNFTNCSSVQCGRNSFSMVGGNHANFTSCNFVYGGYAPNAFSGGPGYVSSSPASCFDIEAESTVIRNVQFTNCNFIGHMQSNTCIVADSGDSRDIKFNNCAFDGVIWLNKPGVILADCRINGRFAKLYGVGVSFDDNTKIHRCRGGDACLFSAKVISGLFMDIQGAGQNGVQVWDSYFYLAKTTLNWRGVDARRTRVTMAFGTSTIANKTSVCIADTATTYLEDVWFYDSIGSAASDPPPAGEGYFIGVVNTTTVAKNCNIVAGPNFWLKWSTWSGGGGGYPTAGVNSDGRYDSGPLAVEAIRLQKRPQFGGGYYGWARIFGTPNAAPSTGTNAVGDIAINTSPANNTPFAWICTVAGSPGTWVPFGGIGKAVAEGPFTPTISAATNCAVTPTAANVRYTRVGDTVTVTGVVSVTSTAAGDTTFKMNLPVASDITATADLNGVLSAYSAAAASGGAIIGDAGDLAQFRLNTTTTSARDYPFTFTYIVK